VDDYIAAAKALERLKKRGFQFLDAPTVERAI
jgi:hypothetical protein